MLILTAIISNKKEKIMDQSPLPHQQPTQNPQFAPPSPEGEIQIQQPTPQAEPQMVAPLQPVVIQPLQASADPAVGVTPEQVAASAFQPSQPAAPQYTAPQPISPQYGMVQPAAPMAYSQIPTNLPSDGSKKKLFLIVIAAVVGLALLGGGGFVAFTILGGVSKADYMQASTDASAVESKLSEMNIATSALAYNYDTTETQTNNKIDTAKKSVTEYKDAVKKLASDKAVKTGSAAKLYKTFKDKNDKFSPIADSYISSAALVILPISRCENSLNNATSDVVASKLDECIASLSALNNISDTDIKAEVDTTVASFKEMKTLIQQYASTPASNYSQQSAIRSKIYSNEDDLSKKLKDIDSNIEKKLNDNDPSDQLKALADSIFNSSIKN